MRVEPGAANGSEQFGDEPVLIAREAAVPVYVGRSRHTAGLLAERDAVEADRAAARLHLLDDAFQHRQLARDVDVVLLHRDDLGGHLLPAGYLREPLSSLRRADIVVVREEDREVEPLFRRYLKDETKIWHVQRKMRIGVGSDRALAFCGIARPEEFFAGMRNCGTEVVAERAFADHHVYSRADIQQLCDQVHRAGARRFITTEKDLARLGPSLVAELQTAAPVETAKLEVTIAEAEEAIRLFSGLAKR
jgi:tetraacyldisaccharide 4'-kinase